MDKMLRCGTHTTQAAPALPFDGRERFGIAPNRAAQGTAVPFAGSSAATAVATAQVAVAGARSTDLLGSPPRGAPV